MSTREQDQEYSAQSSDIESPRNLNPLMTVDDVADYLRLEPDTVRALARDQKIPAIKLGRVWRFKQEDIYAWVLQSYTLRK